MTTVSLDTSGIKDRASFHSTFAQLIGFPAFYGANMDAWIDCMSSLTDEEPMSTLRLSSGEQLIIEVIAFEDFSRREPGLVEALLSCTAFVNLRYVGRKESTRIALVLL